MAAIPDTETHSRVRFTSSGPVRRTVGGPPTNRPPRDHAWHPVITFPAARGVGVKVVFLSCTFGPLKFTRRKTTFSSRAAFVACLAKTWSRNVEPEGQRPASGSLVAQGAWVIVEQSTRRVKPVFLTPAALIR
jgi:hypothetical protein